MPASTSLALKESSRLRSSALASSAAIWAASMNGPCMDSGMELKVLAFITWNCTENSALTSVACLRTSCMLNL